MATTLTNTTLLLLCVAVVAFLIRYANRGEKDAGAWIHSAVRRLGESKLLICVLVVGGGAGLASHILVGYLGPGDLFQDFVGAKELMAGRSLNPTTTMQERTNYWLDQQHLESTVLSRWGPIQRLQANSIDSGVRQLVVQAHPPFHILLIAPLVWLCGSIQSTYIAMTAINVGSYALLLVLIWRSANLAAIVPGCAIALLCVLAFDWQPLLANLRQGQIGVVVALLVIAGWYCVFRDWPWLAGILIGLAALIKMFPALLFFWLLLRRKRAFLAALVTVTAAILFLYLIRGQQAFIDYFNAAKTVEETFGRARINYSLSDVISYVIDGPSARTAWASAAALLGDVLIFGYSAWLMLRNRASTRTEAMEFSGYVVLACLLSPTSEAFYYPILLLPIATVASDVHRETAMRSGIALLLILACFSFPDQVVYHSTQFLAPIIGDRLSWLLCSFPTFAMLALWYWTARRQRTPETE